MFIGSCNGLFRRLHAETGRVLWETNLRGNATDKYFFHGDVFVAADRIIATADVDPASGVEAGVHALALRSGRPLWMYRAGRGVLGAVVGGAGRVFVYTAKGELVALDVQSGKAEWSHPVDASPWESPASLEGRVFAGSNDGSVYAFSGATGRIQWHQKLAARVTTSIRAGGSDVYAGTQDGRMHRLSATTGEVLASVALDDALTPASAPLVASDALLVLLLDSGANSRALVSLDRGVSTIRWRRAAPDHWTTTRVFATHNAIVLGAPSGEVMAYCAADGSLAWSQKLAEAPVRSIGGSDDVLYVGTTSGTLYAVRPPRSCG